LRLIAKFFQKGNLEKDCHKKLNHLRINREWFRYTEEVDRLIEELKTEELFDKLAVFPIKFKWTENSAGLWRYELKRLKADFFGIIGKDVDE
jgi:hypothetical protein